jgi:hypothetical protein
VSERNGDKSRFGRERRKKIFRRKRNRELCAAPAAPGSRVIALNPPEQANERS